MFSISPVVLAILMTAVSFIPFAVLMMTSFVKILVVFSLLRNAIGVQQVPPNMLLSGIALIMTVFIMLPVGDQAYEAFVAGNVDFRDLDSVFAAITEAAQPFRAFLIKHTNVEHYNMFLRIAEELWPEDAFEKYGNENFFMLMPSFALSELTEAFAIGFRLFIPFLVVDIIVSIICQVMGMQMLSPTTISLPLKVALFVAVDGWSLLLEGLLLSYR